MGNAQRKDKEAKTSKKKSKEGKKTLQEEFQATDDIQSFETIQPEEAKGDEAQEEVFHDLVQRLDSFSTPVTTPSAVIASAGGSSLPVSSNPESSSKLEAAHYMGLRSVVEDFYTPPESDSNEPTQKDHVESPDIERDLEITQTNPEKQPAEPTEEKPSIPEDQAGTPPVVVAGDSPANNELETEVEGAVLQPEEAPLPVDGKSRSLSDEVLREIDDLAEKLAATGGEETREASSLEERFQQEEPAIIGSQNVEVAEPMTHVSETIEKNDQDPEEEAPGEALAVAPAGEAAADVSTPTAESVEDSVVGAPETIQEPVEIDSGAQVPGASLETPVAPDVDARELVELPPLDSSTSEVETSTGTKTVEQKPDDLKEEVPATHGEAEEALATPADADVEESVVNAPETIQEPVTIESGAEVSGASEGNYITRDGETRELAEPAPSALETVDEPVNTKEAEAPTTEPESASELEPDKENVPATEESLVAAPVDADAEGNESVEPVEIGSGTELPGASGESHITPEAQANELVEQAPAASETVDEPVSIKEETPVESESVEQKPAEPEEEKAPATEESVEEAALEAPADAGLEVDKVEPGELDETTSEREAEPEQTLETPEPATGDARGDGDAEQLAVEYSPPIEPEVDEKQADEAAPAVDVAEPRQTEETPVESTSPADESTGFEPVEEPTTDSEPKADEPAVDAFERSGPVEDSASGEPASTGGEEVTPAEYSAKSDEPAVEISAPAEAETVEPVQEPASIEAIDSNPPQTEEASVESSTQVEPQVSDVELSEAKDLEVAPEADEEVLTNNLEPDVSVKEPEEAAALEAETNEEPQRAEPAALEVPENETGTEPVETHDEELPGAEPEEPKPEAPVGVGSVETSTLAPPIEDESLIEATGSVASEEFVPAETPSSEEPLVEATVDPETDSTTVEAEEPVPAETPVETPSTEGPVEAKVSDEHVSPETLSEKPSTEATVESDSTPAEVPGVEVSERDADLAGEAVEVEPLEPKTPGDIEREPADEAETNVEIPSESESALLPDSGNEPEPAVESVEEHVAPAELEEQIEDSQVPAEETLPPVPGIEERSIEEPEAKADPTVIAEETAGEAPAPAIDVENTPTVDVLATDNSAGKSQTEPKAEDGTSARENVEDRALVEPEPGLETKELDVQAEIGDLQEEKSADESVVEAVPTPSVSGVLEGVDDSDGTTVQEPQENLTASEDGVLVEDEGPVEGTVPGESVTEQVPEEDVQAAEPLEELVPEDNKVLPDNNVVPEAILDPEPASQAEEPVPGGDGLSNAGELEPEPAPAEIKTPEEAAAEKVDEVEEKLEEPVSEAVEQPGGSAVEEVPEVKEEIAEQPAEKPVAITAEEPEGEVLTGDSEDSVKVEEPALEETVPRTHEPEASEEGGLTPEIAEEPAREIAVEESLKEPEPEENVQVEESPISESDAVPRLEAVEEAGFKPEEPPAVQAEETEGDVSLKDSPDETAAEGAPEGIVTDEGSIKDPEGSVQAEEPGPSAAESEAVGDGRLKLEEVDKPIEEEPQVQEREVLAEDIPVEEPVPVLPEEGKEQTETTETSEPADETPVESIEEPVKVPEETQPESAPEDTTESIEEPAENVKEAREVTPPETTETVEEPAEVDVAEDNPVEEPVPVLPEEVKDQPETAEASEPADETPLESIEEPVKEVPEETETQPENAPEDTTESIEEPAANVKEAREVAPPETTETVEEPAEVDVKAAEPAAEVPEAGEAQQTDSTTGVLQSDEAVPEAKPELEPDLTSEEPTGLEHQVEEVKVEALKPETEAEPQSTDGAKPDEASDQPGEAAPVDEPEKNDGAPASQSVDDPVTDDSAAKFEGTPAPTPAATPGSDDPKEQPDGT